MMGYLSNSLPDAFKAETQVPASKNLDVTNFDKGKLDYDLVLKPNTEMKLLADGKVMKVQKSRQRKILSCVHCHSKKIKCSRVQPLCNNCEKLGVECKYFVNERVSRGGKYSSKSSKEKRASSSSSSETDNKKNDKNGDNLKGESRKKEENIEPVIMRNEDDQISVNVDFLNSPKKFTTIDEHTNKTMNMPDISMSYNMQNGGGEGNISNITNGFTTEFDISPEGSNSLLQTPIVNSASNNITNNFFNTNYSNQFPKPDITQKVGSENQISGEDSFSFNSSNLNFTNFVDQTDGGMIGNRAIQTEHLENKSKKAESITSGSQIQNPSINNSLTAYASNPETTMNYLYGTNTYYDNDNLMEDLLTHLPTSKERSYELVDRYVNSVHILLPIVINLSDFVREHDRYWDWKSKNNGTPGSTLSSCSGSGNGQDNQEFNPLQFYTLFFPILYAATISEFEEYDNLLLNQDISKYLKGFNKICQYYNYPHGLKTMPLLLGNVIIQSTSPNPSTMEMSQIIRYAKFLQLHKDPIITLRISDWEIVKFRRLLWWVIFGLDGLTSHNFCLPPVCRFDDFNVVMPDEDEPIFDKNGSIIEKRINVSVLSMNVKFRYDIILSELVYQMHNGLSTNITKEKVNQIKGMIVDYFKFIHISISKMQDFYTKNPPTTVQENNLINFIKNHSFSFVDRALMLLHKKILLGEPNSNENSYEGYEISLPKNRGGVLSLSQYADTFGKVQEANIIANFDKSSISLLKLNHLEGFSYENISNNLIPSILHNLNDFLKYNDFIKYGKYNWYIKRTIPLDSIILLFVIMVVKFKYEFMTVNELVVYVKLINKALFILNRKWFKNEKYKRMLSLTNLMWEYILKRYNVIAQISAFNEANTLPNEPNGSIQFFDFQVTGYMNMHELFNTMDVPQPITDNIFPDANSNQKKLFRKSSDSANGDIRPNHNVSGSLIFNINLLSDNAKSELIQINERILYDLRNNFVDINDYCAFYVSLEHILHELMDYIRKT